MHAADLEREAEILRSKLVRRSAIIDTLRKAYISDVIAVKTQLLAYADHLASTTSGSTALQGLLLVQAEPGAAAGRNISSRKRTAG